MALKLFRHTGYSTLLQPGEARLAPHPGWLVLAVSVWVALGCNVALWRFDAPRAVLATAALVGGASAAVLGLLGWRRTLKLAVTAVLLAAALLACGLWVQDLPVSALWQQRPRALLPPWPSFLRWPVLLLLMALALLPMLWVWNLTLRRLHGAQQLRANLLAFLLGGAAFAAGLALTN